MGRATGNPITETLDKVADSSENDEVVEAILDAGLAELSVAERAGIGRMTIYRRFNGKKALAQAVLSREAQRFLEDVNRQVGRVSTAADGLQEGFVTAAKFTLGQRLLALDPQHALPVITRVAAQMVRLAHSYTLTPPAKRLTEKELRVIARRMLRPTLEGGPRDGGQWSPVVEARQHS